MDGKITRIDTSKHDVIAFSISGEISSDELIKLANTMPAAFKSYKKVNLLLVFKGYECTGQNCGLKLKILKARPQVLNRVNKFAVVGAPAFSEALIATSDADLPIQTQAFETMELAEAWEFVGAKPKDTT